MDPGVISVTRTLPIDGALLGDVLLRLRRDTDGAVVRWTLGDRGAAEVDAHFASEGTAWVTSGRIWNDGGLTNVSLRVAATADDSVELSLESSSIGTRAGLDDLAHAVVDELAEELLWHAARAGVTRQY
jgi:hypothetical protein